MKQLDPASLQHFCFRQSVLASNGVQVEIEEVSDNLVWLRVTSSPALRDVVSREELSNLASDVFRFLPYRVFVTVANP